ncbi:hypothetical protein K227x_50810 [Rubripirellula lacrimiformis]|uniref:Biotin-protein ligase N-terminal domain-containing protein n=1 Tax=Rubripirellula lacrimiformis TaxID=1930273 RepID=A0A517NHP6_9BACT|nr:BPL-N domain-containing protein [Rubripirellula lacrimiformis]QDT06665.1 hypothetical protein K227x_50810 [Rubripirellula lacrimiformis]
MILRALVLWLLFPVLGWPEGWAEEPPVRVAVFEGPGVGKSSEKLIAALQSAKDDRFQVTRIAAEQIRSGGLMQVDVLVHPGGSGSKQGKTLGPEGSQAVREFVRGGGGYLGVCAGAYLATNDYSWSLNLIDAKVVDRRHWNRGNGTVSIRLSPDGAALFGHDRRDMSIYYAQGPLLARREWDDPEVPDYESLAIYDSEISKNGSPRGVMAGTSAAVRGQFGDGRVLCFSVHPELTDGRHPMIGLAVQWLAESVGGRSFPNRSTDGRAALRFEP